MMGKLNKLPQGNAAQVKLYHSTTKSSFSYKFTTYNCTFKPKNFMNISEIDIVIDLLINISVDSKHLPQIS